MANVEGSSSSSIVRVRIGKYELLRNLGSGHTATVKLAVQVYTKQRVAIKIIDKKSYLGKKKFLSNNSYRKQKIEGIKQEITIMKMLKHPNVVGVIEVMATKTMIYIVMELVNGRQLYHKISQTTMRGMTEDQARSYFQQLMCAVDYFHNKGVSHRDLKVQNLLVDNNEVLKVTDFGLSALPQQFGPDGLLHTGCGTLQYMAPEVIKSKKGYDGAKADIWSCGVILFYMNAGYLPFHGANNDRRAVYYRASRAEYTLPAFFSARLRALIERILVPNPNERISLSEIFEDAWFNQGYQPPKFPLDYGSQRLLAESGEEGPSGTQGPLALNAFEMFSTFVGYGLVGNFFDQVGHKTEAIFISQSTTDGIVAGIQHVSTSLGLNVQRIGYKIIIRREQAGRQGPLIIVTEMSTMTPPFLMIEVRKIGGVALEFHRFYKDLCTQLQDSILKAEPIDAAESILAGARMKISEEASSSTAA